jgi:short-subunit dehydrogenase
VAATFGIDVFVVEPGPVSTNFTANAAHSTRTADDAYAAARAAFERNTSGSRTLGQPPADADAAAVVVVVVVVVEAATTSTPKFRWQTSDFVSRFIGLSLADLDGARVLRQTSRLPV